MRTLLQMETTEISGAGFFEDMGEFIGSLFGGIYDKKSMDAWKEYVKENRDEIVAKDTTGLL